MLFGPIWTNLKKIKYAKERIPALTIYFVQVISDVWHFVNGEEKKTLVLIREEHLAARLDQVIFEELGAYGFPMLDGVGIALITFASVAILNGEIVYQSVDILLLLFTVLLCHVHELVGILVGLALFLFDQIG